MIIELHAIQSFAPSNLNRDDTGNPKEALFGGVRRARISSQSAKRAMRVSDVFKSAVAVPTGTRTKLVIRRVVEQLEDAGVDTIWAEENVSEFVKEIDKKLDKETLKTSVLLYISDDETREITDIFSQAYQNDASPDVKRFMSAFVKEQKERTSAPDIALFGRMLAGKPALNIDAACQVAHAISTHEVNTAEFDYFTAVDDLSPEEDSGAGMLSLVAYNSATYYRCARINWEQLVKNLNNDAELARQTISAFMRAFAVVVPSGMTNSFLNKHQPDFLLAVARPDNDGQSLANAFEKPVRPDRKDGGFVEPSIQALCKCWDQVESCFRLGKPAIAILNPRGYALYPDNYDPALDELDAAMVSNLGEWVDAMTNVLNGA